MDTDKTCDLLNGLIKLDFDAIAAYEAALRRLDGEGVRRRLAEFTEDHRRHTRELSDQVSQLGGTPANGPGLMRILVEGTVVMGGLGHDKGVLRAMSKNESIINGSYEAALEKLSADSPAYDLVRRNREDERRHKDWIDSVLTADDLEVGAQMASQRAYDQRPGMPRSHACSLWNGQKKNGAE
jgi:rubrerythrin